MKKGKRGKKHLLSCSFPLGHEGKKGKKKKKTKGKEKKKRGKGKKERGGKERNTDRCLTHPISLRRS